MMRLILIAILASLTAIPAVAQRFGPDLNQSQRMLEQQQWQNYQQNQQRLIQEELNMQSRMLNEMRQRNWSRQQQRDQEDED